MFLNRLCADESCKAARQCQHMGPKGDYCNFEIEQRLCAILGRTWVQQVDRESLLAEIERRLEGDADLTSRIAERMKPGNALSSLSAPRLEDILPADESK